MSVIFRALGFDIAQTEIDTMIEELEQKGPNQSSTLDYGDFQTLIVRKMLEDERHLQGLGV